MSFLSFDVLFYCNRPGADVRLLEWFGSKEPTKDENTLQATFLLDIPSYDDDSGHFAANIMCCDDEIEVSCIDSMPWDVVDALFKASGILHALCIVKSIERWNDNSEPQAVYSARISVFVQCLARDGLRVSNNSTAVSIANLAYRAHPELREFLPVESFSGRNYFLNRKLTGKSVGKSDYRTGMRFKSRGKNCFKLAFIYDLCHSITTGRDFCLDEETPSLEAFSTKKNRSGYTISPRKNAGEWAARMLNEHERSIEHSYLRRRNLGFLPNLPPGLIFAVCEYLHAIDLPALRQSCKYLYFVCSTVVPGLKVGLYNHQKQALRWMEYQENGFASAEFAINPNMPKIFRQLAENPCCVPIPDSWTGSEEFDSSDGRYSFDVSKRRFVKHSNAKRVFGRYPPIIGGLLCDEPGLGKTISMLALILRAKPQRDFLKVQGDMIKKKRLDRKQKESMKLARGMEEQWRGLDIPTRKLLSSEIFRDILSCSKTMAWSSYECELGDIPRKSVDLSLGLISLSVSKTVVISSEKFNDFVEVIKSIILNTHLWFPLQKTEEFECIWKKIEADLIQGLDSSIDKIRGRYLIGEKKRKRSSVLRAEAEIHETLHDIDLVESNCTLVVVPKTLLSHWKNQVMMYVDPSYFDATADWYDSKRTKSILKKSKYAEEKKKQRELSSMFYFDSDSVSVDLPSPEILAGFIAVFVSTPRLSREERRYGSESVLRKLRWKRVVVDEGHSLGSCSQTLYGNLLREIPAKCRWIMTGTPAKETSIRAGLISILGLVKFFSYPPYGLKKNNGTDLWNTLLAKPLEQRKPAGLVQLLALLCCSMIRHTKLDTAELPPLILNKTAIELSTSELRSYNAIVAYGRTNILLTSLGDRGFESSLLNPVNAKLALELLRNVRLTCCGGGEMVAYISQKNYIETGHLLRTVHGRSEDDVVVAEAFISRVTGGKLSTCQNRACGRRLFLLFLTPCVHLMCVDCFDRHCFRTGRYSCVFCGCSFDPDQFAYLQPGFELKWTVSSNAKNDRHDLAVSELDIQNQNSRSLDVESRVRVSSETSSKVSYLVKLVANARQDFERKSREKKFPMRFKCIVYSQFREVLNLVGHAFIVAFGSDSVAEFTGTRRDHELKKYTHGSADSWICEQCKYRNDPIFKRCERVFLEVSTSARSPPVENASESSFVEVEQRQVRSTTTLPADSLIGWFPGKEFYVGEQVFLPGAIGFSETVVSKVMRCVGRSKDGIWQVRNDLDCFVLLLSKDGSTGLDLSMTSHIFLMDKIWDLALEDQVVSRAWRLGTKVESIVVEQLYSRGTVEELLYDWSTRELETEERNIESNENESRMTSSRGKHDFSKIKYLLLNMNVIDCDDVKGSRNTD